MHLVDGRDHGKIVKILLKTGPGANAKRKTAALRCAMPPGKDVPKLFDP